MLLVDGLHVHGVVDARVAAAAALLLLTLRLVLTSGPLVIAKVSPWKLKVRGFLLHKLLLGS